MAPIHDPLEVKFFIAVLFKQEEILGDALERVEQQWGRVDRKSEPALFDVTDYYAAEMGVPLHRIILSLELLRTPTALVDMKLQCNEIEDALRVNGKRSVNLDCGYLDHHKILLASAKEAGQKVYLDKGIYADLAARFKKGTFESFEWSFPDFKDGRYYPFFKMVRKEYLKQRKKYMHKL